MLELLYEGTLTVSFSFKSMVDSLENALESMLNESMVAGICLTLKNGEQLVLKYRDPRVKIDNFEITEGDVEVA